MTARILASFVLASALLGCAGGREPAAGLASGGAGAGSSVLVEEPLPPPSTLLDRIVVRETDESAKLEVAATEPLVWTSYRNAGGDFVLELVGARPADGVETPSVGGGLISVLEVEVAPMLGNHRGRDDAKEMTRLVVQTREPTVHALRTVGTTLHLTFTPSQARRTARAATPPPPAVAPQPRPVAPPEVPTVAAPTPAVEVSDLDSPDATVPLYEALGEATDYEAAIDDAPVAAPPPAVADAQPRIVGVPVPDAVGPRGDALVAVETRALGSDLEIRLIGNGSLVADPPFELEGPARLVIDLPSVTAEVREKTHYVGHTLVDRLRIGQFQVEPDVARIVLDLTQERAEVRLQSAPDGLVLLVSRR